jgi:radical SAM protein
MDFNQRPILVFWETTRACLLACQHCRAEAIDKPLPGELSPEEGLAFIDSLKGFGQRPPVLIMTGGDVLMRPDAFDLATYARSLDIPVGLSPSVTPLVTPEALHKMHEIGVKSVSISLDGATATTHEGIRGIPGHFAKTLEAMDTMVREGFTIQINTTVMRDNVEELADIAILMKQIGVPIWEVFFLIKVGRGEDVHELTPQENEDVSHFLFDASRYGLLVRTVEGPFFRRVTAWRKELPPDVDPAKHFGLSPLHGRLTDRLRDAMGEPSAVAHAQTAGTRDGKGIIFVGYNGDVYPAGFMPLKLGNIRETSLVDIYRDHDLLKAIATSGICVAARGRGRWRSSATRWPKTRPASMFPKDRSSRPRWPRPGPPDPSSARRP